MLYTVSTSSPAGLIPDACLLQAIVRDHTSVLLDSRALPFKSSQLLVCKEGIYTVWSRQRTARLGTDEVKIYSMHQNRGKRDRRRGGLSDPKNLATQPRLA